MAVPSEREPSREQDREPPRDEGARRDLRPYYPLAALVAFIAVVVFGPVLFERPRPAPDFNLPVVSASGSAGPDRMRLGDLRGRVVLLDFWATWCGPCQQTTPVLTRLAHRYASRGLIVVGVNTDEQGPEAVPAFSRRFGLDYPVVYDDGSVSAQYGIRGLPTLLLVDRTGTIRAQRVGAESEAALAREIERLL